MTTGIATEAKKEPAKIRDERGHFLKGHTPLPGVGAPRRPQRPKRILKEAALLAAEIAGDKLYDALKDDKDPIRRLRAQKLVGYLEWAALEQPGPFLSFLGKIMPQQLNATLQVHHPDLIRSSTSSEDAVREYLNSLKVVPDIPLEDMVPQFDHDDGGEEQE